jgi:hypothetical protein
MGAQRITKVELKKVKLSTEHGSKGIIVKNSKVFRA